MSGLLIVIILLWLFRGIGRARPRRRGMFFGPGPFMGGWHMGPGPGPFGPGHVFRSGGGFGHGGGGRHGGFGGGFGRSGGGFSRGGGGGRFR